jgi:hypothetical protein
VQVRSAEHRPRQQHLASSKPIHLLTLSLPQNKMSSNCSIDVRFPAMIAFRLPPRGSAAFGILALLVACSIPAESAELPNPFPRRPVVGTLLRRWDFDSGPDSWVARHHCTVVAEKGDLRIRSTGNDPYLATDSVLSGDNFAIRLRIKSGTDGPGQIFWSSSKHRGFAGDRHVTFNMVHDSQWHEYTLFLRTDGDLTALRLDPGTAAGEVAVDWIAVHRAGWHPLEIVALRQTTEGLNVKLHNHSDRPVRATASGVAVDVAASSFATVNLPVREPGALLTQKVEVNAEGHPSLTRAVWFYRPDSALDAVAHTMGNLTVQAARDGSVVRLLRDGRLVASLAPLVHIDGRLPELKLRNESGPFTFSGDGVRVTLATAAGGELVVRIHADRPVEGPVVRAHGSLEQGLFAGVEYLGRGEHSSSKLDIETYEHLRIEPDPMKLTMPLMAVVTDRGSVSVLWEDTALQPVFAAPDFLDGTPGHRMALKGTNIEAVIRVGRGWQSGGRLEEAILWAVKRRGLPPLPAAPRPVDEQMQLSLAAYRGMVHDAENGGWFHAVVPGVRRSPGRGAYLADCVSAIWRITGDVPEVPRLQLGGAHVRNSASYFVTGRAADWRRTVSGRAERLRQTQQPDGSYRYDGKFRRGHFENTASGICARPACQLLEHAYYTGDAESLAAGLRTLAFMKRFRTPRGAQTWEVPLHTPDILAAAHAVWAYVRAFEMTGEGDHLIQARRWAITGVPFVYQWSNRPIMAYATTPVYGATHWRGPNWIGLPVQWCGTVYAYALMLLDEHDQTIDWGKIAEGITICAEQMQYPDGPSVGCLPDVFELTTQRRRPADINPGALVSLRLLLQDRLDALDMGTDGTHRIVAPFPVVIRDGSATVRAKPGVTYQVLIDGHRVVDVVSKGQDVIDLAGDE